MTVGATGVVICVGAVGVSVVAGAGAIDGDRWFWSTSGLFGWNKKVRNRWRWWSSGIGFGR